MSKMMQRIGYKANRILPISFLTKHSVRSLSDRSHRLAGLAALAGAQQYKQQISNEFWHPYMHPSTVTPRDMSKQIILDLRPKEVGYDQGHITGAINLSQDDFDYFGYEVVGEL
eukprot:239648_1